jgi:retinol dehydrogenase 12
LTQASEPGEIMTGQIMTGRICVLTGASSGIGRATAIALARLGATMILVARDPARGAAAMAEVSAVATGAAPRLELADLASLRQVRELAARLNELPRIDVLINNAGLVVDRRLLTEDGIEHTFAVNHLAPFLLTSLLTGKLEASGPARIVTVASIAHRSAQLNLDEVAVPHALPMLAYANSKLANILFTRELARRLDGTAVTANCAHPGVVRTGLSRDLRPLQRFGLVFARPFFASPERGAGTVVYLASSPEVAGKTGGYYVRRQLREPSPAARDDAAARKLWEISAKMTGLAPAPPG